jgi:arylsulfatase
MKRTRLLLTTILALLLSTGCGDEAAQQRQFPNIVLAMADDQGWGDMAYNGHPVLKTPVFDEMASAGLRFDRFYAAAPVCSPTRGSVMTGRNPNRFACFRWGYSLRPEETTVAEALKQAGYTTGHFGKWHLGSVRADSPVSPGNSGFDEWFSSPNFYENDPWMSRRGKAIKTAGEGSRVTVDAALDFIRDAAGRKQPFLALVWFGSPHSPHRALDDDLALYPEQTDEQAHFLGEITAMDRAMGHLRQELQTLGIADNTLLWYTSDNGAIPQGSTGGLRGKKGDVWEGGVRVPAIIEWPDRLPGPRTTSIPANTVDIYPTLLDIAGVSVEGQPVLDGISILPLIDGKMEPRAKPMGFWYPPMKGQLVSSPKLLEELAQEQESGEVAPASERAPRQTGLRGEEYDLDSLPGPAAWLDGDYKLHRIADEDGSAEYFLYNIAADPAETTDIATDHTERVGRMKEELETWQRSVLDSLNFADY